VNAVHGSCNLKGNILTIKTPRKRGKKIVEEVTTYTAYLEDSDSRLAYPVIALIKLDGTKYHVAKKDGRLTCDCHNSIIREKYGILNPCKHCLACVAVGLISMEQDHGLETIPPRGSETTGNAGGGNPSFDTNRDSGNQDSEAEDFPPWHG